MTWPWKRPPLPEIDLEDSKRLLNQARERETYTNRVTRHTRYAIAQNHFAPTIKKALEGR